MLFNHFWVGFTISFIGSLPLGVLNLTIIDISLKRSLWQAFYFALAACLVEYGQAFIAIKFSSVLATYPDLTYYINLFVIPVFLGLGLYYFFKQDEPTEQQKEPSSDFSRGLLLSLINPLAIPFWVAWGTIGHAKGWLVLENLPITIFVLGISLGTLATLMLFALASKLVIKKVATINKWINEIIGVVLIVLGLYQIYRVFFA